MFHDKVQSVFNWSRSIILRLISLMEHEIKRYAGRIRPSIRLHPKTKVQKVSIACIIIIYLTRNEMKRRFWRLNGASAMLHELEQVLIQEWQNIPQAYLLVPWAQWDEGVSRVLMPSQRMTELCHETKKLFLICLNTIWHSFLCLVSYWCRSVYIAG